MTKKGNGYGSGTFIDTSLILSPAFLSLGCRNTAPAVSSCSSQICLLFYAKRQFGKVGRKGVKGKPTRIDDNKFTLTYKELESMGISQARATRAFDELLAKGFIEIVHQGGCFDKDKTVYALTDDFRIWRVGHDPVRVRSHDVVRGYQKKNKKRRLQAVVENQTLRTSTRDTHTHVNEGHPDKRHARQRGTPKP